MSSILQRTVDVIIPTYKPDKSFRENILKLSRQTYPIGHILIINTEEKYWNDSLIAGIGNAEVFHISKKEFDHGGTRDMAAGFSDADIIMFMTQDAEPRNSMLVEELVSAFDNPIVKAAYARQLPRKDCNIIEGIVRNFNYSDEGHIRTFKDLQIYGIKTYFCSDVCAAYDHKVYRDLGGFVHPCIFNEDMLFASRLIVLGFGVAYVPEAMVYHSHNYTNMQQFRRNFDNGVSHAMHPEVFASIKLEGEGMKLVKYTTRYLRKVGHGYLIPQFLVQCVFRYAGMKLGERYRKLSRGMILACTSNKGFWDYKAE